VLSSFTTKGNIFDTLDKRKYPLLEILIVCILSSKYLLKLQHFSNPDTVVETLLPSVVVLTEPNISSIHISLNVTDKERSGRVRHCDESNTA
jgi:hypothetical protein